MTVSRTKLVGVALVIFAATVWLYWPSVNGEFLKVDDMVYLRQAMRWNGLTWNAVKWAFTSTDSYYQALPRLSHVLDYQMWGKNAAGHHATSVFLHALNGALVFGFLWTLLGATPLTAGERFMVALWVAVVFAIHPLQTESVAWMSGRTQLLCTTFEIGSIWAYVAGARRWAVWGLYVAALLCKPMAVSLPFVMLAIDYYPLRRYEQLGWGRLLWDKAVLFALAAAATLVTLITKSAIGQILPSAKIPLFERVSLTFDSLMFYLVKLVWPAHLSPHYPSDMSLDHWAALASVLSVLVITATAIRQRRRLPMLAAAWGSYVMLVLPASGLIPTGGQALAGRYAYVAILPVLLLSGGAGMWVCRRLTTARGVVVGLVACELCILAADTRRLIPDWHNDETLRRATLAEFPESEEANRDLSTELLDQGRASEALAYAQRGVEIAPHVCEAHTMLGSVLRQLHRLPEAIEQDEQAVQIDPESARANYGLGLVLLDVGRVSEALEHFDQALRIKPDYADAHYSLGVTFAQMGNGAEAIAHYEQALRIEPDFGDAHCNLGVMLKNQGKVPEAIAQYEQALQINSSNTVAHYNLANAWLQVNRIPEAVGEYKQALRIKPDYAEAHYNLGVALVQLGRLSEAMGHWEQALQIKPDYADAHNNLGSALLQEGRIDDAIGHFEQALRVNPDIAEAHCNLGVALEQAGRLHDAIAQYEQALRIRPDYAQAQNALARLQTGQ